VPKAASSPEAIPRSITAAAPEKQAVTDTTTVSTPSVMSKAAQEKQAGTSTGTSATPHAASGVTEAATALPATTALPESGTVPIGQFEEFPLILDMSREEQLPISEVDSNIWQITTTYDPPDENTPAGISSYLFRDVDGGAAFAVSEVVDGDVPDMRQGLLFSSGHGGGTEKHDEASSGFTAKTVAMALDPTVSPVQAGHMSPVEVTSMAAEVQGTSSVGSDPETTFQGKKNCEMGNICNQCCKAVL
jgi:hypothetical protein